MIIAKSKYRMLLISGAIVLAGCSPSQQPANSPDSSSPAVATNAQPALPLEALTGLKIIDFGPKSTKAGETFNTIADGGSALWVKADRSLDGYDAALWLNGKQLADRAISGTTVTGTVPKEDLSTPGTYALEIRIGKDGAALSSEKVDFVIE